MLPTTSLVLPHLLSGRKVILLRSNVPIERRLKSRFSFLNTKCQLQMTPEKHKQRFWKRWKTNQCHPTGHQETLPPVETLLWRTCYCLNRLRGLKGRLKATLKKRGATDDDKCKCGETQTMPHIVQRSGLCLKDLMMATPEANNLAPLKWQPLLRFAERFHDTGPDDDDELEFIRYHYQEMKCYTTVQH